MKFLLATMAIFAALGIINAADLTSPVATAYEIELIASNGVESSYTLQAGTYEPVPPPTGDWILEDGTNLGDVSGFDCMQVETVGATPPASASGKFWFIRADLPGGQVKEFVVYGPIKPVPPETGRWTQHGWTGVFRRSDDTLSYGKAITMHIPVLNVTWTISSHTP